MLGSQRPGADALVMSSIRVSNPPPGGSAWTSKKSAKRLICRRRAQWTDEYRTAIMLHAASVPVLVAEGPRHSDATGLAYDRIQRQMTKRECRGIPLIGPQLDRMLL